MNTFLAFRQVMVNTISFATFLVALNADISLQLKYTLTYCNRTVFQLNTILVDVTLRLTYGNIIFSNGMPKLYSLKP